MPRWLRIVLIAGFVLLVGAFAANAYGARTVTITLPMKGITELQVGGADLTVVQDDQNKLVIRTTRGVLPWVMSRKTGTLLELGLSDDADPRVLLSIVGAQPPKGPLAFELHTRALAKATVAGGGTLVTDRLVGDSFELSTLSEKDSSLRGVDVANLRVGLEGGKGGVTVSGKATSLYVMNSGAGAVFDGSQLVAGTAEVLPGDGTGKTVVNVEGVGPREY
jgi:hypothetical protein